MKKQYLLPTDIMLMEARQNGITRYPASPPEWAARAAEEIEAALGARVRENTGLQFGFFAGISVNDLAAIIVRHLPNATAQATTPAPTNDNHGNKQ